MQTLLGEEAVALPLVSANGHTPVPSAQVPDLFDHSDYTAFLRHKTWVAPDSGKQVDPDSLHHQMFAHQRAVCAWAIRKGRAAIWLDTGLGKAIIALEWARQIGEKTLIFAPLSVAHQFVREGQKWGIPVVYAADQSQITEAQIHVTNYERLDRFTPDAFGAVVLDESSLLKGVAGVIKAALFKAFKDTPYRLCCTATPAPNDLDELGNHAQFLGVMTQAEMRAAFFVHDECFIGTTLIDTPSGAVPISDLRPGDLVLNAFGVDQITDIATRRVTRLVCVAYGDQKVLCSPHHPWLTTRGWIEAQLLRRGEELVTRNAALRMVRGGVLGAHSSESSKQRAFLQSLLLSEMAHESTGVRCVSQYPRKETETFQGDNGILRIWDNPIGVTSRTSAPLKTVTETRSGGQDQRNNEDQGSAPTLTLSQQKRVADTWWERTRPNASASTAIQSLRRGMGIGSNSLVGQACTWLSELLPRRFTLPSAYAYSRGGWASTSPRGSERAGQEEGDIPAITRVDSVEVYERGCAAFDRESVDGNSVLLHDLTIQNHPSFSVHGALVHNSGWRIKGHAQDALYRWLSTWAIACTRPSQIGYSDDGYRLPPLTILPEIVDEQWVPPGQLLLTKLAGITQRTQARRATAAARVAQTAALVAREPDEQWLIWYGLLDEAAALERAIPDAEVLRGSDSLERKVQVLTDFSAGKLKRLVTHCKIAGLGMNFQTCARMAFVGINDSFEAYYQALRRCWRFGQTREVKAYIVLSEAEQTVYANVLRKEVQAAAMTNGMVAAMRDYEITELRGDTPIKDVYEPTTPLALAKWYGTPQHAINVIDVANGKEWCSVNGDSAEVLPTLPPHSVDLSVFSPPFMGLYLYSPSQRDLGNAKNGTEFWQHFAFISKELLRVTKPGRNVCVHVSQVVMTLVHDGVIGLLDFRGDTIRHFVQQGFIYHGEVTINKSPQVQAIRTHSKGLSFAQYEKDTSWLRPALADYIVIFRAPGENAVEIRPDLTRDQWIEWAQPVWLGIRETETLNAAAAREQADERHVCPLQLPTIERCVRLWSNKGETVLSPFAGIGSEGVVSIQQGRRFLGIELKESYWRTGVTNLRQAEATLHRPDLFSLAGVTV